MTNALVLGLHKTGTTIVASVIQRSLPDALLQMEPSTVAFFEQRIKVPNSQVVKIIYQHWAQRPSLLTGVVRGEGRLRPDKRVAIVRDPRDGVISGLMYCAYARVLEGATRSQVDAWLQVVREKEADPDKHSVIGLHDAAARIFRSDDSIDSFFADFLSYAAWLARNRDCLHVLRYEDFVAGNTTELETYLGIALSSEREVDPRLARVSRTKASGDWRKMMLPEDVAWLRERYGDALAAFGYDDWAIHPERIDPVAGSSYIAKIAEEAFAEVQPQPSVAMRAMPAWQVAQVALERPSGDQPTGSGSLPATRRWFKGALVVGTCRGGATVVATVIQRSVANAHLLADPRRIVLFEQLSRVAVPSIVKLRYEDWMRRPFLLDGIARGESGFAPEKIVAVVRDPRDGLLSALMFRAGECVLDGASERQVDEWLSVVREKEADPQRHSITGLTRKFDRIFGIDDTVDTFFRTFLAYSDWIAQHGDRVHALKYEEFMADNTGELAGYLGIELSRERTLDPRLQRLRRTSAPGGWRAAMVPEDAAYLNNRYGAALARHGYDDWNLRPGKLDPTEGSAYIRRITEEAFQARQAKPA